MEILLPCNSSSSTKHLLTALAFLLFFISPAHSLHSTANDEDSKTYIDFVQNSCNVTMYPSLCVEALTPYAVSVKTSLVKLSGAALSVATRVARNCSSSVAKLASRSGLTRYEAGAVKDCVGDLKDMVRELKQTVGAMHGFRGEGDWEFQWSNAKTWASAAISDAESCLDGVFEGDVDVELKEKIRGCVAEVEKHVSNALSLINHLY